MAEKVYLAKTPAGPSVGDLAGIISKGFDALGGLGAFVPRGAKVLLKPNCGVPAPPESARNTDPRVLEAVLTLLKEAGPGEITIGEASVVGFDTEKAFTLSGIREVAERFGANLIDLKKQPFVKVKVPDRLVLDHIYISSLAVEADRIINLPKLKTISATPISVAMKNLKGLMPDREKKRFHHTDLNRGVVDLNKVVKPVLHVVDGVIAHEMYEPRETNMLLIGRDAVAVDTAACRAIGLEPSETLYLDLARGEGLGVGDPAEIEILGDRLEDVRVVLETAPDASSAFASMFPDLVIEEAGACSGCTGSLYMALKVAKDRGVLEKAKGMTLVIGKDAEPRSPRDKTVYIGKCLKRFKDGYFYLEGCPFPFMDLVEYLDRIASGEDRA